MDSRFLELFSVLFSTVHIVGGDWATVVTVSAAASELKSPVWQVVTLGSLLDTVFTGALSQYARGIPRRPPSPSTSISRGVICGFLPEDARA